MLELTARVLVSRSDQMRGIIRDKGSEFRVYYLKEMARQIADAIMRTPGAVEISEYMNPMTGDLEMRGRVFVADMEEKTRPGRMTATEVRMRQEQEQEQEQNPLRQVFFNAVSGQLEAKSVQGYDPTYKPGLTLEQVEKARKAMESMQFSPTAFLQGRIDRKKGVDDALETSKARVRADNQIRESTKTPGEALPVVTVKVRKIQMPENPA